MTPNRRLDQIEPVLADVAQKTDRLIEGQGQILEIAIQANRNADVAARGVANLTVAVNDLRNEMRQGFASVGQELANVQQGFADVEQRFTNVDQNFAEVRQDIAALKEGQARLEANQQEILTLLRNRLQ